MRLSWPAFSGRCARKQPSSVRQEGSQFAFQAWAIQQPKLHRHIVEPAGPEATIEMPQARHKHSDDGDLDVGPCLVEHEEIVSGADRDLDAGVDLVARIVVKL